jgi:hypothetical protein
MFHPWRSSIGSGDQREAGLRRVQVAAPRRVHRVLTKANKALHNRGMASAVRARWCRRAEEHGDQ